MAHVTMKGMGAMRIHVVEMQAPGKTGALILSVPGTAGVQKFIDLGHFGSAREYLAELGYTDLAMAIVTVTRKEFAQFVGLGDGVALLRSDAATQDPYRIGGSYGRHYAELHNPDDPTDSGSYGQFGASSRRNAMEIVTALNEAYRAGRDGQPIHRGMRGRP